MPQPDIETTLAEAFGAVSRVEMVCLIPRGEILNVFTIIDNDDEETYDVIYNKERSLIHRFPDVGFDFNVIARRGRPVSEILAAGNPIWRRSASDDLCLSGTNT